MLSKSCRNVTASNNHYARCHKIQLVGAQSKVNSCNEIMAADKGRTRLTSYGLVLIARDLCFPPWSFLRFFSCLHSQTCLSHLPINFSRPTKLLAFIHSKAKAYLCGQPASQLLLHLRSAIGIIFSQTMLRQDPRCKTQYFGMLARSFAVNDSCCLPVTSQRIWP